MKGDIAFAGFVLTAAEWQELEADARAELISVATRRADPMMVGAPPPTAPTAPSMLSMPATDQDLPVDPVDIPVELLDEGEQEDALELAYLGRRYATGGRRMAAGSGPRLATGTQPPFATGSSPSLATGSSVSPSPLAAAASLSPSPLAAKPSLARGSNPAVRAAPPPPPNDDDFEFDLIPD